VGRINPTISDINEIARSIAAAIGEQSATTQEIARATGAAATEVLCSASGLAAQARRLRQEVAQLLADIDTV
jgi:methyl-accepting chemotaxis protein